MIDLPNTYSKDAVEKRACDPECIRPWKWTLSDRTGPVPEHVDPNWFHCRSCTARDSLVQYVYGGKPLYVCRNCGNVYELELRHGKYDLKTWDALWKQPYYWKNIDNCPGWMASDLIYCTGEIKTHPIIEAHGKDDPLGAAEMIVRYLISVKDIFSNYFFFEKTNEKYVSHNGEEIEKFISSGNEELVVADGIIDGIFPEDEFCVLREDRDHLTFRCNVIEEENIYGFTADVNPEDWESVAYYTSLKITFLSENKDDLSPDQEVLEFIPVTTGCFCEKRWIIKNPFGLEGYFLFELCKESHDFGYWYQGEEQV